MSYNDVKTFIEICRKPENYNFEFENNVNYYANLLPIDKYFIYKASNPKCKNSVYESGKQFATSMNIIYSGIPDCDGSGVGNNSLIHDVYLKLWGWEKSNKSTFGKIKDNKFNCDFGGETINSVQYLLNSLVENLTKFPKNNHILEYKKHSWKISLNFMIELYANERINKYFIKMLNGIYGLNEYLDMYHTIGNFCLVPAGFNSWRGNNSKIKDNWILSLIYLEESGWGKTFSKNDFGKYTNLFFLWDYVNEKIKPFIFKYDETFIKITVNIIKRRGIFMVAMLKIADENSNLYKEIQSEVFNTDKVYSGYDEVFVEILKFDGVTKNNEIKKMLNYAKNKIDNIKLDNI